MAQSTAPAVFVSSTCFDLGDIRNEIEQFIASLGLSPLLSESPGFPVRPEHTAVQNCVDVVSRHADIFVLIVGRRYGTVVGSDKSVTNLEYSAARERGIPTFVFVNRDVLATLPIWKSNPSGDYSTFVDSPRLFEFVDGIRSTENQWVFSFGNSEDIIRQLRHQLSLLFYDSLRARERLQKSVRSERFDRLSNSALQLVLDKPEAWRLKLFCQILDDMQMGFSSQKLDLDYGIMRTPIRYFRKMSESGDWFLVKINDLQSSVENLGVAFSKLLRDSISEESDDKFFQRVFYVTDLIASEYERLIRWAGEFNAVRNADSYEKVLGPLSHFAELIIQEIDQYSVRVRGEIDEALARADRTGERQTVRVEFNLALPEGPAAEVMREINKLKESISVV